MNMAKHLRLSNYIFAWNIKRNFFDHEIVLFSNRVVRIHAIFCEEKTVSLWISHFWNQKLKIQAFRIRILRLPYCFSQAMNRVSL